MEEGYGPIQNVPPEETPHSVTALAMPKANFGVRIQRARLEANLTVAEAAAKAHCSGTAIQQIENRDFSCIDDNPFHFLNIIERLGHTYELSDDEITSIKEDFKIELQSYLVSSGRSSQNDANQPAYLDNDSHVHSRQRTSALLITTLIVLLGLLIASGYTYKRYQQARLQHAAQDYDLPSLIETPRLPMDVMPIPNS